MMQRLSFAPKWGIFFVLGLALLLLAAYLAHALTLTGGVLGAPLDDAWIHFQYARNLSQGEGFSYVPGVPTPGSTAPLWTLLLAGIGLVTENFLLPAMLLSAALFLLTIWLTYRLTLDITQNVGISLLAAAGLAVTGRMVWASWSAMEVTLFTALSVGAVWAYQRRGLSGFTAVLFALASQTRPEGHVLFALAVLDVLLARRLPYGEGDREKRPMTSWRQLLVAVCVYGALQLPYALFSLSVTGRPLPNTFYAKARQSTLYSWRTLRETLQYHWADNWLTLLLLPFSWQTLWRRNRLVGSWLVGLWLLLPLIVPFLWHHGRYTMPLLPFQMIAAAVGLHWLASKFWQEQQALWLALAGLWLAIGLYGAPYWAGMLGYNAREILDIDVALGEWLAANVPADETVAVDDIGAIVFEGPRPIVDLNGLVSPEMWPVLDDADPPTAAMRFLATNEVRYLAIFPDWHPLLVSDPTIARPLQRFTTDTHSIIFAQEAVVYEMDWPYRQQIAPQHVETAVFAERIALRGYDWLANEQAIELTLYWESLTAVAENYKVFIHVVDETDAIVAQVDRLPVNGLAPTWRWQPGDLVRDIYQIPLPPELPSGQYQVRVGLYTEASGRLLRSDASSPADYAILLEWQHRPSIGN